MIDAKGSDGVQITAEEILCQLRAIALADVTKLVTVKDGSYQVEDTTALTEDMRRAIASVEKSTGGIKVKFYDKLKALELLGKYLGLFDGSAENAGEDSPLLAAILKTTGGDAPGNLQQETTAGHDLVEQQTAQ